MKLACWGCRKPLKGGGWFFVDAPKWKKLALCDACHSASVPSKPRRQWRNLRSAMKRAPRWIGISQSSRGLANWKVVAP